MTKEKKTNSVIITGNGPSRLKFDVNQIKKEKDCELYACNFAHSKLSKTGVDADLMFAIDKPVFNSIKDIVNAVELDDTWTLEPIELWKGSKVRPSNNSGFIAIMWAIKHGKTDIHLYGFDFLLDNPVSNIYEGLKFYETQLTLIENMGRVNYFYWIVEKNPDVNFTIHYPKDSIISVTFEDKDNLHIVR